MGLVLPLLADLFVSLLFGQILYNMEGYLIFLNFLFIRKKLILFVIKEKLFINDFVLKNII